MIDAANSERADGIAKSLSQVEGHFREMPGLRLTETQAARLCALDPHTCHAVLAYLVASGFLVEIQGAVFARVTEVDGGGRAPSFWPQPVGARRRSRG